MRYGKLSLLFYSGYCSKGDNQERWRYLFFDFKPSHWSLGEDLAAFLQAYVNAPFLPKNFNEEFF